jgi:hypothetical protein
MSKSTIVTSIEGMLLKIDDQLEVKPEQSGWMIPLQEDLTLLLAEARHAPYSADRELEKKLNDILDKHPAPKVEEDEESEE